jgi:PAS domain S-box-containing protein
MDEFSSRPSSQSKVNPNSMSAEEELWCAKNDWERTFNSVSDFIAILDNQFRIVRTNKAMAHQLGVTPEKAVGLLCYQCVHGLENPPDFCPHAQTVNDGKEHVAEVYEPRLGGDFLVSTTPLRDEKGKIVGSLHVARNITERKKTEATLSKLNRHLRAISNSNQTLMHATDESTLTQEVLQHNHPRLRLRTRLGRHGGTRQKQNRAPSSLRGLRQGIH